MIWFCSAYLQPLRSKEIENSYFIHKDFNLLLYTNFCVPIDSAIFFFFFLILEIHYYLCFRNFPRFPSLNDRDSNTRISYFLRFIFMMLITENERITDKKRKRYFYSNSLLRDIDLILILLDIFLLRSLEIRILSQKEFKRRGF